MQRGSVYDSVPPVFFALGEERPLARSKLEHREERVRNRYKKFCICIAFALASTLSLVAQSDHTDGQRWEGLQLKAKDAIQPVLTAGVATAPVLGGVSS